MSVHQQFVNNLIQNFAQVQTAMRTGQVVLALNLPVGMPIEEIPVKSAACTFTFQYSNTPANPSTFADVNMASANDKGILFRALFMEAIWRYRQPCKKAFRAIQLPNNYQHLGNSYFFKYRVLLTTPTVTRIPINMDVIVFPLAMVVPSDWRHHSHLSPNAPFIPGVEISRFGRNSRAQLIAFATIYDQVIGKNAADLAGQPLRIYEKRVEKTCANSVHTMTLVQAGNNASTAAVTAYLDASENILDHLTTDFTPLFVKADWLPAHQAFRALYGFGL